MSLRSGLRRVLAEPLPQFLLIGAVLYVLSGPWRGGDEADVIAVGPEQVDYQRRLYRLQFGADPDAATLERLAESYVREESLFREARRLGLDAGDEIVRRRLVAKLEFLLGDSLVPPPPTDVELRDWWAGHRDRYTLPPRASFGQLFFESRGDDVAAQVRAAAALRKLRAARGDVAADVVRRSADVFPPGERFEQLDRSGVERIFGQAPFAVAVDEAPVGEWTGPWKSGYGWHLLRIETRTTPVAEDFAAVRAAVQADWERDWRERNSAAAIDEVVAKYRVVRTGVAPP